MSTSVGGAETPAGESQGRDAFRPLHPDALKIQLWAGAITWAIVMAPLTLGLSIVLLITGSAVGLVVGAMVWLSMAVVLAFFGLYWPRVAHRRVSYLADERGLQIRRGVIWRSHLYVARSRIQHTDVAQGPLQRRLDLARLVVHTAGTHNASTSLTGLHEDEARRIRDLLTAEDGREGDGV